MINKKKIGIIVGSTALILVTASTAVALSFNDVLLNMGPTGNQFLDSALSKYKDYQDPAKVAAALKGILGLKPQDEALAQKAANSDSYKSGGECFANPTVCDYALSQGTFINSVNEGQRDGRQAIAAVNSSGMAKAYAKAAGVDNTRDAIEQVSSQLNDLGSLTKTVIDSQEQAQEVARVNAKFLGDMSSLMKRAKTQQEQESQTIEDYANRYLVKK